MVSLYNRTRHLRSLLGIRLGAGAAILPKNVYRINAQFAPKIEGGHMGARKFWRIMLPRLKYYNPMVSMNVDRSISQDTSPTLTLFLHPSSSPAGESTPSTQTDAHAVVKTIDMKNRSDEDIWREFVEVTGAQEVQPSEADKAMLQELAQQKAASDADRERQLEVNRRNKREEQLMKQAMIDAETTN